MIVYLVEALPVLKVDGSLLTLRYSSSPAWTQADGNSWKARLSVPYRRSFQAFDGAFSDQPEDFGQFEVRLSSGDSVVPVIGANWDGRRVRIWRGAPGLGTGAMELVFDGDADSVQATTQGFQVTLRGPGYALTKSALGTYAGSGNAEGDVELTGTPKPMLLGSATNVEPVDVMKSFNIFQYHAYGPASLLGVFDAGSPLAPTGIDYATFADLKAANIPGGQYSTCNALGMGRYGGDTIDVLTCDAVHTATSNGKLSAILTYLAAMAGVPVDVPTMTWFATNLPQPQDNYVTDQSTFEEIIRDMLLKVGGYLYWTPDGLMSAGLVRRGGAATVGLDRQNIGKLTIRPNQPPFFRRQMGYQRAWRTQSYSELRTPREITPRGTYVSDTWYNYYDLVQVGSDNWLHIGEASTNGTAPAEGAVWTKFSSGGATKTSQLTDDAGLGLTALWPSVSGTGKPADYADVTAGKTAAAITGQGWGATASQAQVDNGMVPYGTNTVVNSRFAKGLYGWAIAPYSAGGSPARTLTVNGLTAYSGARDTAQLRVPTVALASGTTIDVANRGYHTSEAALTKSYNMPVRAGDRVYFSAMMARFRCLGSLYLIIRDRSGVEVPSSYTEVFGGRLNGGQNGDMANYDRVGAFKDITYPTAAWANFIVRMTGTGENDPYLFFTEMFMGKVAAGSTTPPLYSDGPSDTLADQTGANTAAAISGQGALATKNKVGGGDFEVFYNGAGGRVELDGNGLRIYANNGNIGVKLGF